MRLYIKSKRLKPKSWSYQAREMCNDMVQAVHDGYMTVDEAISWFGICERNELITGRAAKRFGRLLRAGKI